jgi:phage tail sheath protein FI
VNPDKFVAVRRTLNYLKSSLKEITAYAVFEPNDERLWNSITMNVSGFLGDFWRSGGLKGASAGEAYFVVCDSTNNTVTSIDNGEVHVDVGVAMQYPAEFIVINLSQWSGGSNAVDSL